MLSGRKVDISRPKSVRLVNRDNSAELNRKVKGCELNSFQRFSNADHRLSSSSSCNSINQNGRRTSTVGEEEPDDDDENNNNGERVRTRIISFWNQVKYGWMVKMKSNFHLESPVWLLGICYCRQGSIPVFCAHPSNSPDDSNCIESSIESDSAMNYQPADSFVNSIECIELFFPPFESTPQVRSLVCCTESPTFTLDRLKHDLYSRIWLTYRKEFPKIAGSAFTSDCGWGCMLRSAQMLLAQTLICHFLNRSWRWTGARSDKEDMIHRMLIKWFADADSSFHCPFSIHQLVKHGLRIGKKPGDWYGPASAAIILRWNSSNLIVKLFNMVK